MGGASGRLLARRLRAQSVDNEDDLVLEPDGKVLFVGVVTGLWTGAGVVALNQVIHVVEHVTRGASGFQTAKWIDTLPTLAGLNHPDQETLLVPIAGGCAPHPHPPNPTSQPPNTSRQRIAART